jgi:hypothetical protein
MPNWLDPFWLFKPKPFLRFSLFVGKWFMRLTSASVELCLRANFGRRYLPRLVLAALLCTFCVFLDPSASFPTAGFLLGLYVLVAYHAGEIFTRKARGVPEPQTFSTGESWVVWQRLPVSNAFVQRYLEPSLCAFIGLLVGELDPFLHFWLLTSAISLFIKQQIDRVLVTRRVLDSIDAKHEAQTLNGAIKAFQQRHQAAQRPQRARLPQPGGRHP